MKGYSPNGLESPTSSQHGLDSPKVYMLSFQTSYMKEFWFKPRRAFLAEQLLAFPHLCNMAKFLPVFDVYHELKYWEQELTESITKLFHANEFDRKSWLKRTHTNYHQEVPVAWGQFFSLLVVRMLCPAVEGATYRNPAKLSDLLECWFQEMSKGEGNNPEKYLSKRMFDLVLLLHKAFASTRRCHKGITDLGKLYKFAELVWEDEQPRLEENLIFAPAECTA